ncbi:MFS transporter (plasmid) [Rhodococcoides fascians A25f]|uniref:MFS transporter n=1 Tax=Rhodococcoides fascians TaxID=1828 RepID=UPI00068E307A|nr:MFS transporter [Rhodococcus fascians]QII09255.1 MFS transporter [Rhodococcus fascians A25f]
MSTPESTQSAPERWWTLTAVCLGTFMLFLDLTVVNVALPAMQRDLSASFEQLQWVIDAYALALAAFLLTAGSIADRLGRTRLFVIGALAFTLASVACGLAGSATLLNAARGVQGLGAAVMYAVGPAMIAATFHGRQRGTAFGIFGATSGIAIAAGPLIGGILTEVDWRWVFYLNIPVGLIILAVVALKVRDHQTSTARRGLDPLGLALFSAGLFALIFGIIRAPVVGWTDPRTAIALAVGVLALFGFAAVERRVRNPMLDTVLFKNRSFNGLSAATFAINFAVTATILFSVLWMQGVLGYSAIETGLRFLPLTGVLLISGAVGGILSARISTSILIGISLLCTGIGFLLFRVADVGDSWTALLPGFVIAGLGMGLHNPPRASAAVALVRAEDSGMGAGINETFQQVGAALGVAVLGALAHRTIESELDTVYGSALSPDQLDATVDAVASGAVASLQETGQDVAGAAEIAFVSALHQVTTIAGIVTLIGAIAAFTLIRRKDFLVDPAAADPHAAASPLPRDAPSTGHEDVISAEQSSLTPPRPSGVRT